MSDTAQNTGQFAKTIVTTSGKEMIAKSQNGHKLIFTRVALGDGLIEENDDPVNFTQLKNERLSANIAKFTDRGNGQFEVQFRVSNQAVETGFWHREIGVMAKIDEGEEQLYAYTSAGNKASFLYDKTTPIEERIVNIAFVIGNAQNVQVIVNSSIIYVTLEDMEEALTEHNSNADSHAEAFTKHNADKDSHEPAFTKHNLDETAHEVRFSKYLPLAGGTLTGNLNVTGHTIIANKFTGTATNADNATKASQDSAGQQINTTYVKAVTGSNATLTVTKGNGATSSVTINNVNNATKASQNNGGQDLNRIVYNNPAFATDCNHTGISGIWRTTNHSTTKNQPSEWGNLLHINGTGGNGAFQLWGNYNSYDFMMFGRRQFDQQGTWSNWKRFMFTTDNFPWEQIENKPDVATQTWVNNLINTLKNNGTLGGIAGGNLAQNGWVKFTKGLLLQWGLALTGEQKYDVLITTTFPISFNEIFQAIPILQGTGKNAGGRGSDCLYSISNNNLIFWHGSDEMGNTGIRYIAIGK